VHELDALFRSGAQNCLVFVDLNFDADRLESHYVLLAHKFCSPSA
jgi:hypothetical protein